MREDENERVSRQGTEAWKRLKRDKSWNDWLAVGDALIVGRTWAMRQAQTNQPQGKGYNFAFSEWLDKYKLADMDKGDRSRLFAVMDNKIAIETWRATLTLTERLKLNHPSSVLRKWEAATRIPKEHKETIRDSVISLSEEANAKDRMIEQLRAHIEELEADRERLNADNEKLRTELSSLRTAV